MVRRASSRGDGPPVWADRHEPVLIGPPCAGKSTLARLLAERSGRRVVCLDALRHTLLPILGCDLQRAEALAGLGDHAQWCRYVRPFEHLMLDWVLGEQRDVVFDVGAGYVLPIDEQRLPDSLERRLSSFAAVVHVSAIEPHCLARLSERHGVPPAADGWMAELAQFYARRSPCYSRLARVEVSTDQEAPLKSATRIEAFLAELVQGR